MSLISLLPRWTESRWNQPLDRELLDHLEPQAKAAGLLGPGPQWAFSTGHLHTLGDMVHAWVGWGRLPVRSTPEEARGTTGQGDFVEQVIRYLKAIDHLGLVDSEFVDHVYTHNWLVADLFSVMDVLELTAFMGQTDAPKFRIVEIGGGWGRVPEMLLKLFPGKIEYVMVDAVPISLVSAEAYLRGAFPELLFGSFARGDDYQPGSYDVYFISSWELQHLGTSRFDVVMNIESFQEMTQDRVDYYLSWFDLVIADRGIAYIANSRDYVFTGDWNFPSSWRTLARHRTPRSWTPDNSTHILRKEVGDFTAGNRIIDVAYTNSVPTDPADPAVNTLRQIRESRANG
ncbi:MAG TPA: putative sugar O-methyltransferase [Gemmatimonas sp.]|uniref:putative sugar O-methyltransferase n=1 Tax=Gemmatimonas sp. TaxID=1962908 RepID=UPI002ED9E6AA